MGKQWDQALPNKEAFEQIFRVLKPGAPAFIMSSPRQDVLWRMLRMLEECGFELRQSFISWIYKTGFPKAMDVGKNIDKKFKAKRRKKKLYGNEVGNLKGRQDTRPFIEEAKKVGFHEVDDNNPVTDLAKQWDGWKSITGLKPALECILMVNKPMSESTIVDNVLKWGTGAINVDACRIPFKSKEDKPNDVKEHTSTVAQVPLKRSDYSSHNKGRFPANLLVSDKAIDSGKITKGVGGIRKNKTPNLGRNKIYGNSGVAEEIGYGDIGDASRYFDLDEWWNNRCIFFDVPKPSKSERNSGCQELEEKNVRYEDNSARSLEIFSNQYTESSTNPTNRGKTPKHRNIHPTVKPIKLMAYLIELGCSKEGIVLDPFVGSGTTCIAAQQLDRKWIGIELNEEYIKIASARLGNVEIVRDFKPIEVKQEIKQIVKNISKSSKPRCGYEGKCDLRDSEGYCLTKSKCNSKVI